MTDEGIDPPPLLGRDQTVPRRRWKWLLPLLVTLAVASLLAVGLVAVLRNDTGSPKAVIDRYLSAVERGDTTKAYRLLCGRFRRNTSFSKFERTLQAEKREAGGVTDHRVARVRDAGPNQRLASYTVRRSDGDFFVDAALVREADSWRVCGFKTRGAAPRPTTTGG